MGGLSPLPPDVLLPLALLPLLMVLSGPEEGCLVEDLLVTSSVEALLLASSAPEALSRALRCLAIGSRSEEWSEEGPDDA